MRGAQKILVCPLAKQQDGQEGERNVSFQKKKPSRHVASKYILMGLGCWGVLGGGGGVLDHGYLYLTFLLVNSNSSIRCCNTGRPSTVFR